MVHDWRLGGNLKVRSGAGWRAAGSEDMQRDRCGLENRFGAHLDGMPDPGAIIK
jgi:hypothetical protein